jgi:GDPmannose 4,6-dehydratase
LKKALITGVTGQDGSYLSEYLLEKNYEVHGLRRRSSSFNTARIDHLISDPHENANFKLHYGDLTDTSSLSRIINEVEPDEIFNLGAQSHVAVSFEQPVYTFDVNAMGTLRILEVLRNNLNLKETKLYQASTSEMFGSALPPQNEETPFQPQSPYAISKLAAHEMIRNYREAYNIFAVSGILFNHESPRRGETFVTRKITLGLARIKVGLQSKLYLGNLNAIRDWGHAKEYAEMQWLMLQSAVPDDYVIGTGRSASVREFCELAAKNLGINLEFQGDGVHEKGIDVENGRTIIEVDPMYFRASEVENLLSNPLKAKTVLGWTPKISFEDLVSEMSESDLLKAKRELAMKDVK